MCLGHWGPGYPDWPQSRPEEQSRGSRACWLAHTILGYWEDKAKDALKETVVWATRMCGPLVPDARDSTYISWHASCNPYTQPRTHGQSLRLS